MIGAVLNRSIEAGGDVGQAGAARHRPSEESGFERVFSSTRDAGGRGDIYKDVSEPRGGQQSESLRAEDTGESRGVVDDRGENRDVAKSVDADGLGQVGAGVEGEDDFGGGVSEREQLGVDGQPVEEVGEQSLDVVSEGDGKGVVEGARVVGSEVVVAGKGLGGLNRAGGGFGSGLVDRSEGLVVSGVEGAGVGLEGIVESVVGAGQGTEGGLEPAVKGVGVQGVPQQAVAADRSGVIVSNVATGVGVGEQGGAGGDESGVSSGQQERGQGSLPGGQPAGSDTGVGRFVVPELKDGGLGSAGVLDTGSGRDAAQVVEAAAVRIGVGQGAAVQGAAPSGESAGGAMPPMVGLEDDALGSSPNVARVARGLRGMVNQNGGSLTIRLDPPELGVVRVQMQMDRGAVRVDFHAAQESVRTLLSHQLGQLRHLLEVQGLTVDKLQVQTSTNDSFGFQQQFQSEGSPDEGRSRGTYSGNEDSQESDDGQDEVDEDRPEDFEEVLNTVA